MDRNAVRLVLVIPDGLARALETGHTEAVQVLLNGDNANTATTVMAYALTIIRNESARYAPARAAPALSVEPRVWYNPELRSTLFLVPGLIAYIAMLTAVVSTALSIVREKEVGTMEQVRMSPVGPFAYVVGKTVPYFCVSLVSSMGIIGLSMLLFDLPMQGSWAMLLLAVSIYIRMQLAESPLFATMKREGRTSKNPLIESFTKRENARYVLLALFGATAGQGVVWYTGQFYALTFMQTTLKIDWKPAYVMMSIALALTTPLFVVFGRLSDRIGRKRVMLTGCALAAATYIPIYMAMSACAAPLRPVPMVMLLALQMVYVCLVYGPIAAFLVELFPTRIRYTSMSLPYHIGNGWFGGFLPLIATAVTTSAWAQTAFGRYAIYGGLLYPIAIAVITLVVGGLWIQETKDHKLDGSHRSD
jgi:ABC-type Na+ efflux pump permease subunit